METVELEPVSRIDMLIEDAITKCQTSGHRVKAGAGDLRKNGFDGEIIADLIHECEQALKYAHLYQAYVNTLTME